MDEALHNRWTLEILQVLKCEEEWTDKVIVDAVEGTHSHFVSGGRKIYKTPHFTHPQINNNLLPVKSSKEMQQHLHGALWVVALAFSSRWSSNHISEHYIEHKEKHGMSVKCPDVTIWKTLFGLYISVLMS